MINSKKKGFTIVELVIVVAVIAILAAVLIPTFSNLVKKANLSADQVAVKNMNTVLATSNDDSMEFGELVNLLSDNGFNSKKALIPTSKDYVFYWYSTFNKVILVDETDKVIFPADETIISSYERDKGTEVLFNLGNSVATSTAELTSALANGGEIYLIDDVELKGFVSITSPGEVTINLNGHKMIREDGTGIYVNNKDAIVNICGEGEIISTIHYPILVAQGVVNVYSGKFTGSHHAAYTNKTGIINIYGGEFYSIGKYEGDNSTPVKQNATSYGATLNVEDNARGAAVINVYVDDNNIPYGKFYNQSGENGSFQLYDYSKQVELGEVKIVKQ